MIMPESAVTFPPSADLGPTDLPANFDQLKWFRRAFWVQATLLGLCVVGLIYVSWRFSGKQREYAAQLAGQKAELAQGTRDLNDATKSLVTEKYVRGQQSARGGNYKEAINLYDEALQLAPGDSFILRSEAKAYIQDHQASKALTTMVPISDAFPSMRTFVTLAMLHCAAGDPQAAAKDLARVDNIEDRRKLMMEYDLKSICPETLVTSLAAGKN